MSKSPAPDLAVPAAAPARISSGWPLLLATAVWAIGLPQLPKLAGHPVSGVASAVLLAFAILSMLTAVVALMRMPSDPVTAPFVGLAATVGTLLALAPLDRPAGGANLISFLLVSPWRYALTPVVVHLTLEVGWSHRRPRWAGWILGWYAIVAGMLVAVAAGLVMDEVSLVDAVDRIFRINVLEPAGAATAIVAGLLALGSPVRGRVLRPALTWTTAAVAIGLMPMLLAPGLPLLRESLDGDATAARLALFALPALGVIAVLSLPFRDMMTRDLIAHRLAAGLLEGTDLSAGLRQIAVVLHETFNTRGVTVRLMDPEIVATVGEVADHASRGQIPPGIEAGDEHHELVAPIGRAGSPLGEVRLDGRFAGAFGPTERDWLAALLQPIAAVLRVRRRELACEHRTESLARHLANSIGALATAAREVPTPTDTGMAIPPPVDAREVLAQMSDGVTGIARSGEGLAASSAEARDRARGASDSVARGLDALSALSADVAKLARYGDEISSSNDTVSGVAFRTNLVANNAALEATRAGAAGRTFGVLAEEVRRLADTTAATSAAIGERTAALAAEVARIGSTLDGTRQALAAAIREAEAGEAAAQRLNDAAVELEDTARGLRPVVAEANAVANRRTARDQHLTTTMERFLDERALLSRALALHRDAMERLAASLAQLVRNG